MSKTSRFWDKIAKGYAKQPIKDEAAYQKKISMTRDYLDRETQILEIGCGTGSTALTHAPHVGHIHAIDVSKAMISIARSKAENGKIDNISFQVTAMDDFNAPENSYDVVMAMSVLHLLDNRDTVIARVHNILRPGGVFVSSTPCLTGWMVIFKILGPLGYVLGVLPMLRVFSVGQLETSLTLAGFDIEQKWQPGKNKAIFFAAKKPS